ncbi:MAG: peroxiredoxin [Ignavibacteriales bacterium]|nr:peroxiredoxin [Ignavibacteriales bacterium]
MALATGSKAPQFTLFDTDRKQVSLSDFAGKKVVLVFYPGAFTGVCTKELCRFRDALADYNSLNAQVLAISVDGPFANKAFKDQNNITYPMLSDYTRSISLAYGGIHQDFAGLAGYTASKRAVYVLDAAGTVTYAWVSDNPGVEPPYDEVKKAAD